MNEKSQKTANNPEKIPKATLFFSKLPQKVTQKA